jgi:hypothetical protein
MIHPRGQIRGRLLVRETIEAEFEAGEAEP